MADRAVLCGINSYPDAPLAGCLNDISDMAALLTSKCGFKKNDIRLLADRRATAAAIKSRLAWLVQGAVAGDRLFFMFSGHGAQVTSRDPISEEVDGLDEVICPSNFNWDDDRMIRDNDFEKIFSAVPSGVQFIWISDSCHSGSMERGIRAMGAPTQRAKSLPPPIDMDWRNQVAQERGIAAKKTAKPNVLLISGCQSHQTSADARFGGRPNGALTFYLLKVLSGKDGLSLPLSTVVKTVQSDLKKNGFSQIPQIEGPVSLSQGSFFVGK